MIESLLLPLAGQLLGHLGKRGIDHFWRERSTETTILNGQGLVSHTQWHDVQQNTRLFGTFYISPEWSGEWSGWEVPLVLVAGLDRDERLLFDANLDSGYEIDLPPGDYFICALIVDQRAPDLLRADIQAYGFPSRANLRAFDGAVEFDHLDSVWSSIEDRPIGIGHDGPYFLDFLLLSTAIAGGLPGTVDQLIVTAPSHVTCPHCTGSGYVGWAAIARLGRAGFEVTGWQPGPCRLCGGHGAVAADFDLYRDIGH